VKVDARAGVEQELPLRVAGDHLTTWKLSLNGFGTNPPWEEDSANIALPWE
jgi:hypothetical protein